MQDDDLRASSNIEDRRGFGMGGVGAGGLGIGAVLILNLIGWATGNHVQNMIGLLLKVHQAQRDTEDATAKYLSVRTELMADCLAGAWANHRIQRHQNLIESDLQQAVTTAAAIGDDRLQRAAGRAVVPDSFTHGSSQQRVQWLTTGFRNGTIAACNTFPSSR